MTSTSLPTSSTPFLSGTAIRFRTCFVLAEGEPTGMGVAELAK